MIELRPHSELGGAHHGWLDTRHPHGAPSRSPEVSALEDSEIVLVDVA